MTSLFSTICGGKCRGCLYGGLGRGEIFAFVKAEQLEIRFREFLYPGQVIGINIIINKLVKILQLGLSITFKVMIIMIIYGLIYHFYIYPIKFLVL